MKYDNDKPDISHFPVEVLRRTAKVFMFGAEKYARDDYRKDINNVEWSRHYASLQRHLMAWLDNEDLDPESKQEHLAHAVCQLMILYSAVIDGDGSQDNRYKGEKRKNKNSV